MTARERIDAALAARPQATPGPWDVDVFEGNEIIVANGTFLAKLWLRKNWDTESNATLIAAAPDLVDEVIRLRADNAELNALFDMQYKRTGEATEAWRKANPGNDNVLPDLGALLEWMLGEMARLRAWQEEALPYLNVAAAQFKPRPLYLVTFNSTVGTIDRLIAEAQEAKE